MRQNKEKINRQEYRLGRWLYVILGIIIMLFLGTVYSYSVFRLSLEEIFGIGSTESGMPYMIALAFYAFFMLLTGKYLNQFNPRNIILLGGLLVAIGWILSSFATNIIVLTITYGCISGAGVGIVYGVPMTVVAKWFPEKKGFAVGMVLIGFGLSPLIAAPIVRLLVEHYGVMRTFLVLGIVFAIALPILAYPFKYPVETDQTAKISRSKVQNSSVNRTTKEMIRSKSFKGLYLNFLIGTMIGLMLIGKTMSVGIEYIGLESNKVIAWMTLFAIFNGLGRPIFGWLTDKLDSKKAMLLSYTLIILAAVLIIAAGQNNQLIYIISFSIFWFNLGGWLAIAPASTMRLYGLQNYSQNYGLIFTAYGIGAVIGVSTSGFLLDLQKNYHFVFYYVITLAALGMLITMRLVNNEKQIK